MIQMQAGRNGCRLGHRPKRGHDHLGPEELRRRHRRLHDDGHPASHRRFDDRLHLNDVGHVEGTDGIPEVAASTSIRLAETTGMASLLSCKYSRQIEFVVLQQSHRSASPTPSEDGGEKKLGRSSKSPTRFDVRWCRWLPSIRTRGRPTPGTTAAVYCSTTTPGGAVIVDLTVPSGWRSWRT